MGVTQRVTGRPMYRMDADRFELDTPLGIIAVKEATVAKVRAAVEEHAMPMDVDDDSVFQTSRGAFLVMALRVPNGRIIALERWASLCRALAAQGGQ